MAKQELEAAIAKHGLSIRAEFIPWSQSRNKDQKDNRGKPVYSLNWRVTLIRTHDGSKPHEILTTDYSAGIGHAPTGKKLVYWGKRTAEDRDNELRAQWECEHGFPSLGITWRGAGDPHIYGPTAESKRLLPDTCDVICSLVRDADVLDTGGFAEWAGDFGYDTDSRKAEAIYRACLEIALKLRAGIGEAAIAELRDASQDY
jgi:hypothetical protein